MGNLPILPVPSFLSLPDDLEIAPRPKDTAHRSGNHSADKIKAP